MVNCASNSYVWIERIMIDVTSWTVRPAVTGAFRKLKIMTFSSRNTILYFNASHINFLLFIIVIATRR